MPTPPTSDNNCQSEGIFSPVAGVMGSLQANEVLKTILNDNDNFKNQILIFKLIRESFFAINEIILNKTKHYHIKFFSEYGKKLYLPIQFIKKF